MTLDVKKTVEVGKDRAISELCDIVNTAPGYFNLDESARKRVKKIADVLSLPDDYMYVITALDRLGFINGEEDIFFQEGKEDNGLNNVRSTSSSMSPM